MNELGPISNISGNAQPLEISSPKKQEHGFMDRLREATDNVNQMQQDANLASEQVIKGELGIHEGMLSLQQADLSLRLFLQVRNKVMDAYREIMRMPI